MTSRASDARGARNPRSHYEVILIVTSFAIELATPTVTDVRTDTLLRLIYKDYRTTTYMATTRILTVFHAEILCSGITKVPRI